MGVKRRRRVLLFIDSLGTGGAQTQILNLAYGLQCRGFSVLLLTYYNLNKREDFLIKHRIEHICIEKSSRFSLSPIKSIQRIIKNHEIDVAISFLFTPSAYLLLAGLFNNNLRIIISERTGEENVTKANRLVRLLYIRANIITANSSTQTNILKHKLRFLKSRIFYVPNCVVRDKTAGNLVIEKKTSTLKICAIGRLVPLKNYEIIIKAINEVKGVIDIKLDIYGKSFPEFSYYFESLRNLIEEFDLQKMVFLKGEVSNIHERLPNYELLIHASHIEGFPNVICEALCFGVPVIASNISDVPSIVKENYNGYLFFPDDYISLAQKIVKFFSLSSEHRAEIRVNAQRTVELNFSIEKYSDNYIALIE